MSASEGNSGYDPRSVQKLSPHRGAEKPLCGALSSLCVYATDIQASSEFYLDVLGLKEIQTSPGGNNGRWFSFSNGLRLQIVGGNHAGIESKRSHLTISTSQFDATVKFLIVNAVDWGSINGEPRKVTVGPNGLRQIFLKDPDANLIEIIDEGLEDGSLENESALSSLPPFAPGTFSTY